MPFVADMVGDGGCGQQVVCGIVTGA